MGLWNMLRKDIIAYRKTWIWSLFYIVIFPFAFRASMGTQGAYVMIMGLTSYMITAGTIQSDERSNINYLLGVMPVKRSTIVGAKIMLINVTAVFCAILYTLLGVVNRICLPQIEIYVLPSVTTLFVGWMSASAMALIFVPLSYKLDSNRGRMAGTLLAIVVIMAFTAAATIYASVGDMEDPLAQIRNITMKLKIPMDVMWGMFAALSVIFQAVAYGLCRRIYEKKDF